MANSTITTNDVASVALEGGKFIDALLAFAAADTFAKGTILARKLVSDTIGVGYTRAGDSNYTAAASQNPGRTLQTGAYVVTAGTLTAGVGTWTAKAPNGETETYTTAAASNDLLFPRLGLTLDVTAVSSEWDTGDVITATVAAQTGTPLVPYSPTGTGGEQGPMAVLTYEVSRASPGNAPIRALVAGEVNASRLIIDEDGDGSNVTAVILDQLRGAGIVATAVQQLSVLDNGAT